MNTLEAYLEKLWKEINTNMIRYLTGRKIRNLTLKVKANLIFIFYFIKERQAQLNNSLKSTVNTSHLLNYNNYKPQNISSSCFNVHSGSLLYYDNNIKVFKESILQSNNLQ